jgi:hypothetical protein
MMQKENKGRARESRKNVSRGTEQENFLWRGRKIEK